MSGMEKNIFFASLAISFESQKVLCYCKKLGYVCMCLLLFISVAFGSSIALLSLPFTNRKENQWNKNKRHLK